MRSKSHTRAPLPNWDLHTGGGNMVRSISAQNVNHPDNTHRHVVNISFDGPSSATMSRAEGHKARENKAQPANDGNWIFRSEAKAKEEEKIKNSLSMRNIMVSKQMEKSKEEFDRTSTSFSSTSGSSPEGSHVARAIGGGTMGRVVKATGGMVSRGDSPQYHETPKRSQSHDHVLSRGGDRVQVHQDFRRQMSPNAQVVYHRTQSSPLVLSGQPQTPRGHQIQAQTRYKPSPLVLSPRQGYTGQVIYVTPTATSPGYRLIPTHMQGRYVKKVIRSPSHVAQVPLQSPRVPQAAMYRIPPSRGLAYSHRSSSVPDLVEAGWEHTTQTLPRSHETSFDTVVPAPSQDFSYGTIPRKVNNSKDLVYRGEFVRVRVPKYNTDDDLEPGPSNLQDMQRSYHSEPNLLEVDDSLSRPNETSSLKEDQNQTSSLEVSSEWWALNSFFLVCVSLSNFDPYFDIFLQGIID